MARKFKSILKAPAPKIRDVCIVVSEYLKLLELVDLSPNEVMEQSTKEELMHNFILARCHYGRRYGIRFNKEGNEPPKRIKSIYWVSYDWKPFKYNPHKLEWKELSLYDAMIPGTRNIFEDENQRPITTEDLYKKVQKLEEDKTEPAEKGEEKG